MYQVHGRDRETDGCAAWQGQRAATQSLPIPVHRWHWRCYIGLQRRRAVMEKPIDDKTRTELEAAAFRTLVEHLRERTDVQNIDLMNLAGFCRNCLSKWYRAAAGERGIDLPDPKAREIVYGMPYDEWRAKHQKEASAEQKAAFDASQKH